jgi:uncharacterized damage-inducible protein DinB
MVTAFVYIGFTMNQTTNQPEPWLRGTLTEVPAVQRAVLHALQAADEDLNKWCANLTDDEIRQRPAGMASVAFHLRHIPGSIDRLLTYAEGRSLSEEQIQTITAENGAGGSTAACMRTLLDGLEAAANRVRRINTSQLDQPRSVGRRRMPTTVGGLLVHVADHTQRHVGQAITTARVILGQRNTGAAQ